MFIQNELFKCFLISKVNFTYSNYFCLKITMANKRDLKKSINSLVFDVIDESIYIQEIKPEKFEACEKLIDEAVNYYNNALSKMNSAKAKSEFRSIAIELEESAENFIEGLNALNS